MLPARIAPCNDAGIRPTYSFGTRRAEHIHLTGHRSPRCESVLQNLSTANSLYADGLAWLSVGSAAQTFNVTSPTSGYIPGRAAISGTFRAYNTYAGYVQDNWKVFSHATVTLGMRYEIWTPVTERDSLYLVPNLENGNIVKTLLDPNAVLNFAGGPNTPLYKTDKNNFAPNVGLAWDPSGHGKTVIRGGYMVCVCELTTW